MNAQKTALKLFEELDEKYSNAIISAMNGELDKAITEQTAALLCSQRLERMFTVPSAASAPTSTIWVGLAPATVEHLLATNAEFSRQYEDRSKTPGKSFTSRDGMAIEFIGTELGLCLGVKFITLREGFTRLPMPEIILTVEEVKRQFGYAMDALGVLNTKDLLEVLVQTK